MPGSSEYCLASAAKVRAGGFGLGQYLLRLGFGLDIRARFVADQNVARVIFGVKLTRIVFRDHDAVVERGLNFAGLAALRIAEQDHLRGRYRPAESPTGAGCPPWPEPH